ncbi:uncharacterized protein PFL1_04445 [Pseudozyma flocculosa PF-1]|uniref:Uncharacterized protein n=1 Tax=Pseudozyma flocculosa PF-1 TaxID=1277687 RepID=A0A061H674_9BASI|nr:uncharacterized protein PFL1_04445 [Pseudozyma flocculosa PF-1]EPQ28118.1 hypothetical protein PFL1_04445 [Pseudozyma flocculosa PF-1]
MSYASSSSQGGRSRAESYANHSDRPSHRPTNSESYSSDQQHSQHSSPFRSNLDDSAYEYMAIHLLEMAQNRGWIKNSSPSDIGGISLRRSAQEYITLPLGVEQLHHLHSASAKLKYEVALVVNSALVRGLTSRLAPGTTEVPFSASERIQVIETMQDLEKARRAHKAAFVRQQQVLVCWTDDVDAIEGEVEALLSSTLGFIMMCTADAKSGPPKDHYFRAWSTHQSRMLHEQRQHHFQQQALEHPQQQQQPGGSPGSPGSPGLSTLPSSGSLSGTMTASSSFGSPGWETFKGSQGFDDDQDSFKDEEAGDEAEERRPIAFLGPLRMGFAVAINILMHSLSIKVLVCNSLLDHHWIRMAYLAFIPVLFTLSMFFCCQVMSIILLIVGPIQQMSRNSRYYSGKAPKRIRNNLPHVTIQMPVYKESIETVIEPTLRSLQAAIRTYELQGGTASVIISDDGMLLLSAEEQAARQSFYDQNDTTWIARPGHGVDGFVRRGRFKKASNLNFTCQVAIRVEDEMRRLKAGRESEKVTAQSRLEDRQQAERLLPGFLQQLHPLARGHGDARIGELILLVDSDTRVPEDCLLDAASEMRQSPELGVLQHCSGVMLVSNNYFERGIAYFTKMVNFSISHGVACGDVAPFVGHNAFLRWSAIREVAFEDDVDPGVSKIWSDAHVSEDFDMALRLLMKSYVVRWATYSQGGFLEGVSLTAEDELNRWQKYAFGCSELMLNRLWQWPTRGPLAPLFRRFLWSKLPIHYKFSACAYLFSYYAIALCVPLSIALYLVMGWFGPTLDVPLVPSFEVLVAVLVVFTAGGNVSLVIGLIRSRTGSVVTALVDGVKWVPFFLVFFGGLSYHVLVALVAHPLGINMTWGATLKDLDDSNFFRELPAMFKRFWVVFLVSIAVIGGAAAMALAPLPLEWVIVEPTIMVPLIFNMCFHILYPLVLNPSLLRFSF